MSDLPAGRELDALVAEKVMGFWLEEGRWWTRHANGKARAHATSYLNIWGPSYAYDGLPKFSTDIAAAFEVVAKLLDPGVKLDVIEGCGDQTWLVRFGESVCGSAETAPLAICRAALRAVANRTPGDG